MNLGISAHPILRFVAERSLGEFCWFYMLFRHVLHADKITQETDIGPCQIQILQQWFHKRFQRSALAFRTVFFIVNLEVKHKSSWIQHHRRYASATENQCYTTYELVSFFSRCKTYCAVFSSREPSGIAKVRLQCGRRMWKKDNKSWPGSRSAVLGIFEVLYSSVYRTVIRCSKEMEWAGRKQT